MKYVMTDNGRTVFFGNRSLYRSPTVYNKIMSILSSGVGYSPDSLLSFIQSDPLVKNKTNDFARILNQLSQEGYVKSISDDNATPLIIQGGE